MLHVGVMNWFHFPHYGIIYLLLQMVSVSSTPYCRRYITSRCDSDHALGVIVVINPAKAIDLASYKLWLYPCYLHVRQQMTLLAYLL
jgi:hypothetical protein